MKRIDHSTAVSGQFVESDPSIGQPPTQAPPDWWQSLQEEVAGAVEDQGIALSKPDNGQLEDAVRAAMVDGVGTRNLLTNGDFRICQRYGLLGSRSMITEEYVLDRWAVEPNTNTVTVRQVANTLDLPDGGDRPRYAMEVDCTSFLGPNAVVAIQKIEDVRRLAGATVTVSGYAEQTNSVEMFAQVVQDFGSGGSAFVDVGSVSVGAPPTGAWGKFQATFTIPSVSGKTIGQGSFTRLRLRFSGVTRMRYALCQLELGDEATLFEIRPRDLEIQRCRRFYEKSWELDDELPGGEDGQAHAFHAFELLSALSFKGLGARFREVKRASPTMQFWSDGPSAAPGEFIFPLTTVKTVDSILGTKPNYTGYPRAVSLVGAGQGHARAHWTADAEL